MSEQTAVTGTPGPLADPEARRALMADVSREPGSAKPDPILEVDHIIRNFGGMTAVHVEHLEVQRGIITALIGPNGAGKTTFFNLITGFDKPSSAKTGAHWSFEGNKLDKTSASSVALAGMVRTFQLTKSLNRMTVMDNMMLGARGQRGENLLTSMFKSTWGAQEKAIEAKAIELLHRFKLHTKIEAYRSYALADSWLKSDELRRPPSAQTLWAWRCAYPKPYNTIVESVERRYQLPESLVYAVMRQESAFRPNVVSPAGAIGLMQLCGDVGGMLGPLVGAAFFSGGTAYVVAALILALMLPLAFGLARESRRIEVS